MGRPWNIPPAQGVEPASPFAKWAQQLQQVINGLASQPAYEIAVPTTGFSNLISNATGLYLLTPAAGLATGTVTLPAQASDGFIQTILSSQTVTALTVAPSASQTIVGATAFTLTASVAVRYMFVASTSTWYKM